MRQQKPQAEPGVKCPLWRKDVSKVCHTCAWYIKIEGKHPQSGATMDNWGCSMEITPILLLENALQTRGAAAATEMARDTIIEQHQSHLNIVHDIVSRHTKMTEVMLKIDEEHHKPKLIE